MMIFLKHVSNSKKGFQAIFSKGAETDSTDAAKFFMMMQDKGEDVDGVFSYIKLGKMIDPLRDWDEIHRIALTFYDGKKTA